MGEYAPDVKVYKPGDKKSYSYHKLCHCNKCNIEWYLDDCLRCPKCGGTHTYDVVEPIDDYAPEG